VIVRGVTTAVERVAPGEVIEVTLLSGIPNRRSIVRFPVVSTISRAMVHNNDLPNVLRALRERVFGVEGPNGTLCQPPRPEEGVFMNVMEQQRRDILKLLRGCQPITSGKFLEHYKGAKRARYERAIADNLRCGIRKESAILSMFVKAEFVDGDAKLDPAPRAIQPRHPRYNAALGLYIQPLEGRIYRAIAKLCGGPTVMKGYNADQVGKLFATAWRKFRKPWAIGMDASRFDQHVSVQALKFEHLVYLGAYSNCSAEELSSLKQLLEWQVHNEGRARLPEASLKYKVDGNRMSGDMNTALGNCLLMCLMVRQYCMERAIQFRLFDNGDDATVIIEEEDVSRFQAEVKPWFLKMGFTMKVEAPVDILEQVEFCQTHPVLIAGEYRMVRNPLVAMSKDTTWKAPALVDGVVCSKSASTWLNAVGECGMSLCGGVPIMQEFYSYLLRHPRRTRAAQGFGSGESGFERMARGMCRRPSHISPEARRSFWLAFGVLPDAQVAIEGLIRALAVQQPCRRRIVADCLNRIEIPVQPLCC
jgi:hypothetical protein